ncbi:UvrD-helicase domain-containing protein [Xanthomonas campestris]|uniref:UvrD-helicase domain-containing protein n=1 Tax=Xanthomonas campestris TaxID=339 RepID=UPI001E477A7A|nr:UvrD-helicase domain-containing protein [Xanthomonas campestris]MCC5051271.1 UvrD-helicase domain-containing protein [Xanthomonas campestris pv. aberrans]MEB1125967.1 UvrD-helicase domain-containing protein [Xanthomonas campestris pv. campestris]
MEKGFDRGRAVGHDAGFAEGRLIYEVIEAAPLLVKAVDDGLYGPSRLGDVSTATLMKTDVEQKVAGGLIKAPTDEQWEMILTDHPATCVSAGAGSGKSTTLVLRIVYMLVYLKIPDHELTVISFTKDSCVELRKKLIEVLSLWRHGITSPVWESWAKERVRTFHSVLYWQAVHALPGRKFFENLKNSTADHLVEDSDNGDVDNPASASKLNEAQVELIAEAYRKLFSTDVVFRQAVIEIFKAEIFSGSNSQSDKEIKNTSVFHSGRRDEKVIELSNKSWEAHGWPFDGVAEVDAVELATVDGQHKFYANGVHKQTRTPIVLGFSPSLSDEEKDAKLGGAGGLKFSVCLGLRIQILTRYAGRDYIYIRNESDLANYKRWNDWVAASSNGQSVSIAPIFNVKLDGEMKPTLIYEALFVQGSFIETLGWEVGALLAKIPAPQCVDKTVYFCRALGRFWPHLNKFLGEKGVHTYNRAFLALTHTASKTNFLNQSSQSMRHLLVDEFQDISPLIVNWLKVAQKGLLTGDQTRGVSIMAIGDDWQSIYGWRGSAPQLFIDFGKYFPVHADLGNARQLLFKKNFRSVEPIVQDAERLLSRVKNKVSKTSVAVASAQQDDHGVKLITYGDQKKRIDDKESVKVLAPFIEDQYKSAKSRINASNELVIVMTRRRSLRNVLSEKFPEKNYAGLRICTYHQAKGLEADVAILIEDCVAGDSHPLRNMIYAASGLYVNYTYDLASEDEAMRLAYVGITRGRRKVFWQVSDFSIGGAAATFKAN